MMDFLASLENMQFSIWVRESGSLWAFPMILFMHTLGMSIVAGHAGVRVFPVNRGDIGTSNGSWLLSVNNVAKNG